MIGRWISCSGRPAWLVGLMLVAIACVGRSGQPAEESKSDGLPKPGAAEKPPAVEDIVARFGGAVVYITAVDALGEKQGSGSGCVISADGLVVTNFHVLAEAASAYVQFRDGKRCDVAGFRAVDRKRDLVILQLKEPPAIAQVFAVRDPGELRPAQKVIAIGHPADFKFTVTEGIVSAVRTAEELPQEYQQLLQVVPDTTWVQTTAAISGGSSGGPLLTATGELVGLITWIAAGQNLGFAVHTRHLIDLQQRLRKDVQPLPLPGTNVVTDARVARLLRDYVNEYRQLIIDLQRAPPARRPEILLQQHPTPRYLRKLRELAAQHVGTPTSFAALLAACRLPQDGLRNCDQPFQEVLGQLREQFLPDPRLEQACWALIATSPAAEPFLRDVIRDCPHAQVRGVACCVLAELFLRAGQRGESLYNPEIIELYQRIVDHFPDLEVEDTALGAIVRPRLFRLQHLTPGRKPPAIQGPDFDGVEFRLRDYLGQVVVLDFWADWCPHCRAMYPHERKLFEQHKDRPFALLGVNCDQPETGREAIKNKAVIWRSWMDGPQGKIAGEWQNEGVPTIYVLDPRGVIRFRFDGVPQGNSLDEAVEELLEEAKLTLPQDLVAAGHRWKYRDDGADPGPAWRAPDFDDASWADGPSPLGYGLEAAVTRVGFGKDPDRKPLTTYFRTTFSVAEVPRVERLLLALYVDDGAAVYLNGVEVTHTNLDAPFTAQTPAASRRGDDWWEPTWVEVDPSLLQVGRNVLAAEVHQHSNTSADLHFDLSLSTTLPPLGPLAASTSTEIRRKLCRLLAVGAGTSAEAVDVLQKLAAAPDPFLQTEAIVALWQIDPVWIERTKLPPAANQAVSAQRRAIADRLNESAWRIAAPPGASPWQYQRALRRARAALALSPDNGAICNTVGVAEYRAGLHQPAVDTLQQSVKLQGPNPIDFAFLAMAHHQLGNAAEAKRAMEKAESLRQEQKQAEHAEARRFVEEAQALLKSAPTKASP